MNSTEYPPASFGDLIGAELVILLRDWMLVQVYPPNATNVPVMTSNGNYANQHEYLEAEYGMLHCIEQAYRGITIRITFYRTCLLCEANPDQENCEAVLIEPMPDPTKAQDQGAQDNQGASEEAVLAVSNEFILLIL